MKYSNWLGVLFSVLLIIACFIPWIYIPSQNIFFTGMNRLLPAYGRPGLVHIFLAGVAILCFFIPKLWAKRANIFICAINVGWGLRNFIIISSCSYGECPERKSGMLIALSASALMMVFSFLPDIKVKEEKN